MYFLLNSLLAIPLIVTCLAIQENPGSLLELDHYEASPSTFFPQETSQHSSSTKVKFPKDDLIEDSSLTPLKTAASERLDDIDERTAIDIILAATKAGRKIDLSDLDTDSNLPDLSQLTTDPKITAQIAAGNEAQARNYIRNKLCDLGLMQGCGAGVDSLTKKHGYGEYFDGADGSFGGLGIPLNEIRLVQPVAIKPVGPPISAVPLDKPFKNEYLPPPPPRIYGPPLGHSSHGKQLPLPVYGPPAHKPLPGILPPYNPKPYGGAFGAPPLPKPLIAPLHHSGGKIVEHIHHHIHHSPVSTHGSIGTYGVIGSSGGHSYGGGFDEYGDAQKPVISLATPGGTSLGSLHQRKTNDLDYLGSTRDDCTCVQINQCSSYDIVQQGSSGREVTQGTGPPNSGLVGYNIDPRTKYTQFQPESNATDSQGQQDTGREPRTLRRKREEPTTLPPLEAESPKVEGQGRFITSLLRDATFQNLTRFAGYDFGDDPSHLVKMEGNRLRVFGRLLGFEPTWGVSFGLPGGYPQAGGGYPLNPFGTDPVVNPYNGGGIDLGPISINPLVSFQKTKDKDKTKVFKPLVNLHITPNPSLIYGIKGLFHKKKAAKLHKFGFGTQHVPYPEPVPVPVPVLPFVHQHDHYHQHQYPVNTGWGWPSSYSYPYAGGYRPNGWSYPSHHGYGRDATAHAYYGGYSGYTGGGGGGYRTNHNTQSIYPIPSQYQRDSGGTSGFFSSSDTATNPQFSTAPLLEETDKKTTALSESETDGTTDEESALIQELLADGAISQSELDELNLGDGSNQQRQSDVNDIRKGRTLFPSGSEDSHGFRSEPIVADPQQFLQRRVSPTANVETRLPVIATSPEAPHSNEGRLTFGVKPSSRVTFPDHRNKRSRRQVSSQQFARVLSQTVNAQRERQLNLGGACPTGYVCCRKPVRPTSYPAKPTNYLSNSINNFVPGQCGRRNARGITGRVTNPGPIVEGESDYGEWPWQVAILKKDGYDNVYVCGGTIIDERHVVTAAHCLKGLQPNDLRVRLGEWDVNHETEFYPHVERDVAGFALHPDFYAGNLYNDIAVMRLEGAVDFRQNPHVSPICLPPTKVEFGGQRCLVTGWGKDAWGDKGKYQNVLKEVDVPVLRHFDCEQKLKRTRLGPDFALHQGFICAGGEEGKDACKGDGGGPLVCNVQGTFMLTGIVSWGVGCGHREVPGVYVKVSHYREWLEETTKV